MAIKLSRRETIWVALAGVVIALFLLFEFAVFPFIDYRRQLVRRIDAGYNALSEMRTLRREYDQLRQSGQNLKTRLASRERGFSLFTFVESLAGQAGLKAHIAYMKPSAERRTDGGISVAQVEMKLEGIDLEQLVRYLYSVESSSEMVFVNRLSVSKGEGGSGTIDAVMQVETIEG
jgi:general secretion pathway protein M